MTINKRWDGTRSDTSVYGNSKKPPSPPAIYSMVCLRCDHKFMSWSKSKNRICSGHKKDMDSLLEGM